MSSPCHFAAAKPTRRTPTPMNGKGRVDVSQELDPDGGRERNAIIRVESCGHIKVMKHAPALPLETVETIGRDSKGRKLVNIVETQRRPTISQQTVERKRWKRVRISRIKLLVRSSTPSEDVRHL